MDKSKYKSDFITIRNLVNDLDVCGFIKSGSLVDEYENITNILLSSIYNSKSKMQTENKIINEIENYYGMGKIEDKKSLEQLKIEIEKLINKSEIEIQNKPSH